jgi:hypothetical protein
MRRSTAGMTLLEVMIAGGILVVIALMAMTMLQTSTHIGSNGTRISEIEQRGNRLLNVLHDELPSAQFTSTTYPPTSGTAPALGMQTSYNNTAIVYQLTGPSAGGPTGTMTLSSGYRSPITKTFDPMLAVVLRFEADTVYLESSGASFSPTQFAPWPNFQQAYPTLTDPRQNSSLKFHILNIDIDGNGSRADAFVQGRIMKYVINSLGLPIEREQLDGDVILKVSGSGAGQFTGDVAGDGKPVYLFSYLDGTGAPTSTFANAVSLQINAWHGRPDDTGKGFILRNNKMVVHFRN